ncbi:hypothetical protein I5J64_32145, partial [Pseudomonas aeruginosa]|nr:hypothetical protein [Pseudomonas aeruginosa]
MKLQAWRKVQVVQVVQVLGLGLGLAFALAGCAGRQEAEPRTVRVEVPVAV